MVADQRSIAISFPVVCIAIALHIFYKNWKKGDRKSFLYIYHNGIYFHIHLRNLNLYISFGDDIF